MAEYVGGTSNSFGSGTTMTLIAPGAVQPGDKLYLFAAGRSSDAPPVWSDPLGWARVDGSLQVPTVTRGAAWERTAQAGDALAAVTVGADRGLTAAVGVLVAFRGYDMTVGQWFFGEQAPVVVPVELAPGDLFAAFAFSANNATSGPLDTDGVFPRLFHPTRGFNPTLHGAFLSGLAPTPLTQVTIGHDIGTTWASIGVFAVSGVPAQSAPRIRSSVSEDAGSLFQATQAAAVELGLSEAFEYGADIPAGRLRSFSEALTPDATAVSYYPLPTRNQEMLTTVEGETNLGRLAGVYPSGIMVPATSIPGAVGGVVTAQQAIQYVTAQWASAHPWLSFAPIPDLRLMVPSAVAAPRQHYLDNPGDGVLTTAAVVIPQEGNERRSMREILDEWLAIFPGTIVRQTSTGVIELVPRVGPDAPSGAAVTLTWGDLTGISDGEDDPSGVTNRCRVTSQGWEFTDNQTLRPPAFVVSIGGLGIDRSVLDGEAVIPDDAEEFQPWRTIPFTVLVDGGNNVTVNVGVTAFGSWNRAAATSFSVEGTAFPSVTLAVGQSAEVSITHTSRALSVTATWRLMRVTSVAIDVVPVTVPSYAENPLGRTYLAYLLEFDIIGTAWVRSNESVTSEFGQDGVGIPADGGGDAIADSRAQYGERLAQLQSNIFQLTPEQAQAAAQSYVLWNVNPRTIRDVQQSEWNKFPVRFDHIGRLVDLPTGERAVIENRSYSDSFSSTSGMMRSTFSASVTEVVIDTDTHWLLLDDGDWFQLDSGEMVEES
ncbi:MAG TPA: hypothetical protein VFN07_01050 [Trueperaceae bacterium]|nr:hypothetical protein [Trueperaceae bacterium]